MCEKCYKNHAFACAIITGGLIRIENDAPGNEVVNLLADLMVAGTAADEHQDRDRHATDVARILNEADVGTLGAAVEVTAALHDVVCALNKIVGEAAHPRGANIERQEEEDIPWKG